MAKIGGREVTKNTVVGISLGSLGAIIVSIWTLAGVGRPLFAADLERIENKIDSYQTNTSIQILNIRKAALQSELRVAKRELRNTPSDDDVADDIDEIEGDIADLDVKITCHRTKDCRVESDI